MTNKNGQLTTLADYSEKLCQFQDFAQLADNSVKTVARLTGTSFVSLLIFNLTDQKLVFENDYPCSRDTVAPPRLEITDDVAKSVLAGGTVLALDHDRDDHYFVLFDEDQELIQACELRIPFYAGEKYYAILSLGKKESGTDYSVCELDALRILVNILANNCRLKPFDQNVEPVRIPISPALPDENLYTGKPLAVAYKRQDAYSEILGSSEAIFRIKKMIDSIARTDASVLITGESGTGKELVARAIHRISHRTHKPLVVMNCASIPENLVESELFGHEKGAFTGAVLQKKGKFEFAHQSTFFLDEIGDMSLVIQAKLLRVLQDGIFQRVGGNALHHADVRLIAATNKNLLQCIQSGLFREDLYYRINVVQIEVPALRDRIEDIPVLAEYFFEFYDQKYQRGLKKLHAEILSFLLNYSFPGNVRELKNFMERAVILNNDPDALPHIVRLGGGAASAKSTPNSLEELEKQHIHSVLLAVGNNKSEAARRLGIARKTLREKIDKYSL